MSSNTTAHHEDFDAMLEEALDAMDANNVRNLYSDMHEDEAYANLERQLSQIFESVTRVGGEVCRMRAEVDELLEQNQILHDAFKKLKEVICEKGVLDLDDFQLACDVFDEVNYKP
jgi:HrpA-like RNA helicase